MLSKLREEINRIDRELIALYEERMAVAAKVADAKKGNSPILNEEREQEVIADRSAACKAPYTGELFEKIMELSRRSQLCRNLDKHIILIGMMGSGKTQKGRRIAKKLSLPFYDTDAEIEKKAGMSIPRFFETYDETAFRETEREVFREVLEQPCAVIATGGGIVTQPETMELIGDRGIVVFLNRSVEDILSTLDYASRPLAQNPEQFKALYETRLPLYRSRAQIEVDGAATAELGADAIIKALETMPL